MATLVAIVALAFVQVPPVQVKREDEREGSSACLRFT